jgi:beta-glucosidase
MTVDYFASHELSAAPIFSETRDTNSLTWFAMPGDASPSATAAIRASGVFTPKVTGEHQFYAGATGPVRLLLDGQEVYRCDDQPPPSDLMGVLKAGEANHVAFDLIAGRPVQVVLELRYAPFRVQGLWYGVREPDDAAAMMARAEALAREADTVVLMVGESSDSGVESRDRRTTHLDADQLELIARVCAANPNTAVIVNAAHAVDLAWAEQARAVMMTWFPGEMFGPALAEVIAGDREPGGRLPVSFAYADTDYPAFDLTPDGSGGAQASVTLRNTGSRPGKAVVQAYLDGTGEDSGVSSLAGWTAVRIEPGEQIQATLKLAARVFASWDEAAHAWITPDCARRVRIGFSSRELPHAHFVRVGPSL